MAGALRFPAGPWPAQTGLVYLFPPSFFAEPCRSQHCKPTQPSVCAGCAARLAGATRSSLGSRDVGGTLAGFALRDASAAPALLHRCLVAAYLHTPLLSLKELAENPNTREQINCRGWDRGTHMAGQSKRGRQGAAPGKAMQGGRGGGLAGELTNIGVCTVAAPIVSLHVSGRLFGLRFFVLVVRGAWRKKRSPG